MLLSDRVYLSTASCTLSAAFTECWILITTEYPVVEIQILDPSSDTAPSNRVARALKEWCMDGRSS